eukprot:Gb_23249 [translate_table: standard]
MTNGCSQVSQCVLRIFELVTFFHRLGWFPRECLLSVYAMQVCECCVVTTGYSHSCHVYPKEAEPEYLELKVPDMVSLHKSAFTVDLAEGFLPGCSSLEPHRQKIVVTFSPEEPKLYKEVITVIVANGRGIQLKIEGQGILERPLEPPPATIVDTPRKQQPTPRKQHTKKSNSKS